MPVDFVLRRFDHASYGRWLAALDDLLAGTASDLVDQALGAAVTVTRDARFRDRNGPALAERWERRLHAAIARGTESLSADERMELDGMLVALLAMPDVEIVPTPSSESCVALDGPLLLHLRDTSEWFDALFAWDVEVERAAHAFRGAMTILDADGLDECIAALDSAAPAPGDRGSTSCGRLIALARRARSCAGQTLALSEE